VFGMIQGQQKHSEMRASVGRRRGCEY